MNGCVLASRFEALDSISRVRALTEAESLELERLLPAVDRGAAREPWRPWTAEEDRALAFVDRGKWGWARAVATVLGRTETAVRQRVLRLEAQGRL